MVGCDLSVPHRVCVFGRFVPSPAILGSGGTFKRWDLRGDCVIGDGALGKN